MAKYKTNLAATGNETFSGMMSNGFGIVTVMNVSVYNALSTQTYKTLTPYDIVKAIDSNGDLVIEGKPVKRVCYIDTLKVANVTQEGPTKTVTGGQYVNPLIKFGKTARLEMQDALGRIEAIEALGGGVAEWDEESNNAYTALHVGSEFAGPKMLIGESFFIDRESGRQVPVNIIFYQFSPDSIFNLTQDAEGDATVFDMNGDLLTTDILVGSEAGETTRGMFYSIVAKPNTAAQTIYTIDDSGKITITNEKNSATLDNETVTSGTTILEEGTAGRLVVTDEDEKVVLDTIISR